MNTFNYWTIVGPTMILASFVIGWHKNKRHYCVIERDRYSDILGLFISGFIALGFIGLVIGESSDGCLQFWRDILPSQMPKWLSKTDEVLKWFSFLITLIVALVVFEGSRRLGEKCGRRHHETAAKAFQRKCANGSIACAANCQRACKGCPNADIIVYENVIIDLDGVAALERSTDPDRKLSLAYCKRVRNLNTGEYAFVTKHRNRGSKYSYFEPLPLMRCIARDYQPQPRTSEFHLPPVIDFEERTQSTTQKVVPMPAPQAQRKNVKIVATVNNGQGASGALGFIGPEDSDIMQRAADRFMGGAVNSDVNAYIAAEQ